MQRMAYPSVRLVTDLVAKNGRANMATTSPCTKASEGRPATLPVSAFLIGAAASVSLGAYASIHEPSERTPISLIFTGGVQMKVWCTTIAVLLAIVQLFSAL
jgi:hypothetical protein